MGWTTCIIWFLYMSVSECWRLPDSEPLMHGEVQSPQYPRPYPPNLQQQWNLSVPEGFQIRLTFIYLDIEASPDCLYDALTVLYDGKVLGKFCGHETSADGHHPGNQPMLSPGNRLTLILQTDGNNPEHHQNVGFSAQYQAIDIDECSAPEPGDGSVPLCSQICLNTVGSYLCYCHHGFELRSDQRTCVLTDCGEPKPLLNGGVTFLSGFQNQYRSVVQYHCNEPFYSLLGGVNDTYTCNANGEWISDGGNTEVLKCIEVCGKPEKHPPSSGRILGGKNANLGEIPWHLLIKAPNRGGASLINDRWAVTAACVVEGLEETSLRLYGGLVDGRTTSDNLSNAVVMDSERIIIHPNYSMSLRHRTNFDNDIALIRLTSRVKLGPNLLPICLPKVKRDLLENEQGTVSGFGKTETGTNRFVTSQILKYAHIGVYSLTECQNTPSTSTNQRMIFTNNMFCAGAEGKDSCQQDGGGPLVFPMLAEGREPYYLTGIVSWGPPCNRRQYKGYYTKVENYVDWIKETIDRIENS